MPLHPPACLYVSVCMKKRTQHTISATTSLFPWKANETKRRSLSLSLDSPSIHIIITIIIQQPPSAQSQVNHRDDYYFIILLNRSIYLIKLKQTKLFSHQLLVQSISPQTHSQAHIHSSTLTELGPLLSSVFFIIKASIATFRPVLTATWAWPHKRLVRWNDSRALTAAIRHI